MEPSNPIPKDAVLATATRSGSLESWHRGSLVVVEGGRIVHVLGDPDQRVYCRSAVKPLQALPLLECGLAEKLGLGDGETTVMIASHNGTDRHLEAVRSLLERGGLEEEDLRCGPHPPFDREASLGMARRGEKPRRIHNNCSGKHAGFLHQADAAGVPRAEYLHPECASQLLVRRTVAEMAELEDRDLETGLDGCGAPTFRMPLSNLAIAFQNLANPDALSPVRSAACRRLLEAAASEPVLLAGEGRFCTALMRAAPGQLMPKNGAEGIYAIGLVDKRIGIAVKISDGNERGYWPVVVELLSQLGLWSEVPAGLSDFRRVPIYNTQKLRVGEVTSAFSL